MENVERATLRSLQRGSIGGPPGIWTVAKMIEPIPAAVMKALLDSQEGLPMVNKEADLATKTIDNAADSVATQSFQQLDNIYRKLTKAYADIRDSAYGMDMRLPTSVPKADVLPAKAVLAAATAVTNQAQEMFGERFLNTYRALARSSAEDFSRRVEAAVAQYVRSPSWKLKTVTKPGRLRTFAGLRRANATAPTAGWRTATLHDDANKLH